MSASECSPSAPDRPLGLNWPALLKRLTIWAAFLIVLRLTRDFFFVAFMTFLFSYLALILVDMGMRWLSRDQERRWLRRLLTIVLFLLGPLALIMVGSLIGTRLLSQTQQMGAWLNQVGPETASTQFIEDIVGPYEFKLAYHGPEDPKYVQDLQAFHDRGILHVKEYNDFPALENWVEGGFSRQFAETEQVRIRLRLTREGTSSRDFEQWFLNTKLPSLQELSRRPPAEWGHSPLDSLVRSAAVDKPDQVLLLARREPDVLEILRQEWMRDAIERGVAEAKRSSTYHERLRAVYDQQRAKRPDTVPYSFEEYVQLQSVRPQGPVAFGHTLEKIKPSDQASAAQSNFEAAKKHELFEQWWSTNPAVQFVRRQTADRLAGVVENRLQPTLAALVNTPIDIGTAMLLSFFICIDFQNLRDAFRRLRGTWLRDMYEEIVPALVKIGRLIGRALLAQGIIALCNATMIYIALWFLGVEHDVLLSVATFVLCLVPTLGAIVAMVMIATVALLQYDGGIALALKASAAVALVLLMESFVLSPRILGRMMELHPVLIIAILPIAQYFFGVWGLILATPVAVFIVNVVIFNRGLPGDQAIEAKMDK